jgi:hypothetical protein
MQIPKRLEPPQGASPELEQAYLQILLDKVSVSDKLKQSRKLLDSPETRQKQIDDAIQAWRIDSLLPYAVLCLQEMTTRQAQTKAQLADFEKGIEARRVLLGVGMGKMLGDEQAGKDLCSLLVRMGGGVFNNDETHTRDRLTTIVNACRLAIETAKTTIADIEALKTKPMDSKQTARKNKQNLLANLENQNTENDNQKGE